MSALQRWSCHVPTLEKWQVIFRALLETQQRSYQQVEQVSGQSVSYISFLSEPSRAQLADLNLIANSVHCACQKMYLNKCISSVAETFGTVLWFRFFCVCFNVALTTLAILGVFWFTWCHVMWQMFSVFVLKVIGAARCRCRNNKSYWPWSQFFLRI